MPEDPRPGPRGGAWSAPLEQLRLALRQPVLAALPELGVVAVQGADPPPFLNTQLTVDVTAIDAQRWPRGAYSSVTARVLALFAMWRGAGGRPPTSSRPPPPPVAPP